MRLAAAVGLLALLSATTGANAFRSPQSAGQGIQPQPQQQRSSSSRRSHPNNNNNNNNNKFFGSDRALIRGGGADDGDEDDDEALTGITKTAVSVGVGLVLLRVLTQQPPVQDLLSWLGWSSSKTVDDATTPKGLSPPQDDDAMQQEESHASIIVKTFFSVTLTATILWSILYGAQLDTVTEFYANLGLWHQLYGLPPMMYVAFWFLTFTASAVTELVAGGISSMVTLRPTETPSAAWYETVEKPKWNPPGWVFPVMWLIVSKPTQFLALRQMFLASFVVAVKKGGGGPAVKSAANASIKAAAAKAGGGGMTTPNWPVLALYCVHLALGNAWNDVFFGYQKIDLGLNVMVLLWASLVASAILFYQETPWAGYLMIPTCLWVTVATALNWSISLLNKQKDGADDDDKKKKR